MVRAGDLANARIDPVLTVAVVTGQYMNLSLRLGYHFNLVGSYLGERASANHIYFRFFGGGAGLAKRLRRISLIETVLSQLGFTSRQQGDLIEARISNISRHEGLRVLNHIGRLIAFTRQLDTALDCDAAIKEYVERFMRENKVA